jgi:hypothetical protein
MLPMSSANNIHADIELFSGEGQFYVHYEQQWPLQFQ